MKILVCGGRDYADFDRLCTVLDGLDELAKIELVIHGGARGADELAGRWAAKHQRQTRVFPADWNAHGKAAGPIRNRQMLKEGAPDLVVAFPGGRGTADMIRVAKSAGVRVIEANA
jgi:hypothetical protein